MPDRKRLAIVDGALTALWLIVAAAVEEAKTPFLLDVGGSPEPFFSPEAYGCESEEQL